MIQPLNYFRVTCDEPDCVAYINFAAVDRADVHRRLETHKWSTQGRTTHCPTHSP